MILNQKAEIEISNLIKAGLMILVILIVVLGFANNLNFFEDEQMSSVSKSQCKLTPSLPNCAEILEKELTNSQNLKETDSSNIITTTEITKIAGNYNELLNDFGTQYHIDPMKLKAFLIVESSGQPFDGDHPTVRFECLRYNDRVSEDERVPCETNNYKYGDYEYCNKNAFLNALTINEEQALLQSSFGIGQIMGFNYGLAGYKSVEKYYKAMFDEEEQIKAFLNFILNNIDILTQLQQDDTNWAIVAENYNGKDYETNKYDIKLETTYENLA